MKRNQPILTLGRIVLAGVATAAIVAFATAIWLFTHAEMQGHLPNGINLPSGKLVSEIDATGDPAVLPSDTKPGFTTNGRYYTPVAFSVDIALFGHDHDDYYERRIVRLEPGPLPPPGWGASVTAYRANFTRRPELVEIGVPDMEVDWVAVGRGEVWKHTQLLWSGLGMLALRVSLLGAIYGVGVSVLLGGCMLTIGLIGDRRKERTAGCCTRCGYSREGLEWDAKCPECGNEQ